jgi:cell division protein FtsI/penicillin-binding protein 2
MKSRDPVSGPRRRVLLIGLLLTALLLIGRGFQLQVLEAGMWGARAQEQHSQLDTLPAPRGTIYDRNGVPLAASRESFRIGVAPREVTERAQTAELLERVLSLTPDA